MRGRFNQAGRRVLCFAAAATLAATLAACTDDEAAPANASDDPSDGGTIKIYTAQSEFSTLDPQRVYVVNEANASKLITRTLTTYQAEPGEAGSELVGDLATDTGRPNDDYTAWEFTLRDGVNWETGDPVTCEDVRYGVLRSFDVRNDDAAIVGGAPWPTRWLDVPEDYAGPRDGDVDVDAVTCHDDKTIEFRTQEPVVDFPYGAAMTAFAPVPADLDTWEDYGESPLSNGPYRLAEYEPATEDAEGKAVFERNSYWDSDTDEVRRAAPDAVEYVFGIDREHVAQQIISENPEYDNAVMYESVPSNSVQQVVNDGELSAQTVEGDTNAVRYMAINTETVADPECRQALMYGFDKQKFRDVYGGATVGDFATTMMSPDDPGHKEFDVYGLESKPEGDLDDAEELLEANGECPDELTLDVEDSPVGIELAETIVETYARLGIIVEINAGDPASFFEEMSHPENQNDLILAGWAPDWPGGSALIPPLFDGEAIVDGGNNNFSLLDDPDVNSGIEAADAEADTAAAHEMWGELDEEIQQLAAAVPILHHRQLSLCGKNVRGAFLNTQLAGVDVSSLGLAESQ